METATVTEALSRAAPCDVVWVCPGTWYESVEVPEDVAVIGLGAREDVVVDASSTGGTAVTAGPRTLLRSLTVTGGDASGIRAQDARLEDLLVEGNRDYFGGGLSLSGDVVLADSEVRGNEASWGGGWSSGVGTAVCVRRTAVHHNRGGALSAEGDRVLVLEDVDISNNVAEEDAGIAIAGDTVKARRTTVCGNEAYEGTGGVTVRGYEGATNYVSGLDIIDNIGGDKGGGLNDETANVTTLEDLVIERNRALYGGGVSVTGRHLTMSDSFIRGNTADASGGGLYAPAWGDEVATLCRVDFGGGAKANAPDDIAWMRGSVSGVGVVTDSGCPP